MQCRPGCGACCISPSISSSIPGMENGKAANTPCVNLDNNYLCTIFGQQTRPKVCSSFQPNLEFCGENREQALFRLLTLEQETQVEL